MQWQAKHLLTGNELSATELLNLLDHASEIKRDKLMGMDLLRNQHLALLFDKPSLRTRFSFTIAMRELGGDVVESLNQTRKAEEPEDQIRVIQGYCSALMVRTHKDQILERMQAVSQIPIINGLSELYHPCQSLADILTLKEYFSDLNGLTLCYIGDGNNVLHSLLLMAPKLGINVHYCCPKGAEPDASVLAQAATNGAKGLIKGFTMPQEAVSSCNAIYTDVWTSMGFDQKDEKIFDGFQVNESLMKQAKRDCVFMHCMPMERGKEVSETLPDQPYSLVFQQSENRLHVQKALLVDLLCQGVKFSSIHFKKKDEKILNF